MSVFEIVHVVSLIVDINSLAWN